MLNHVLDGRYILIVTYPGYADYTEDLVVDKSKQIIELNRILLTLRSKLLEEVVVKGRRAAIQVKGDTTEYDAGAFKVQPNASVEDLLRQLPGIQVNKDGQITARGKSIQKVLPQAKLRSPHTIFSLIHKTLPMPEIIIFGHIATGKDKIFA